MRNTGGYVKLYRSMLDWQWYQDDACARIMLHLLLTVNREPKEWKGQVVEPGQLITSMDGIATALRLSRSAVRRALEKMKSSGEVTIHTNNHWTTVTLANWGEYQVYDQPVSRQKANHRPTTDRPVNQPSATTEEVEKKRRRETTPSGVVRSASLADRKALFVAACKSVTEANPDRLAKSERVAFLEYWTEPTHDGKAMRFEGEKYFDHGRRMDTWRHRNEKMAPEAPKSTEKSWVR